MFPAKLLFCHLLLQTPVYDALREAADTEQVTEQVEKLISVMGDKVYKSKALMELLGLKHRPTFRKNYLLPVLKLGLIEMTVPDKPNSSKQKYAVVVLGAKTKQKE